MNQETEDLLADTQPEPVRLPDVALFVGGKRYTDGPSAGVSDPWTLKKITEITLADASRAQEAMRAAVEAFDKTRRAPSYVRRRVLDEITKRIAAGREDLASLITRESGKPRTQALIEVDRAVTTFGLAAEEAVRMGGEVMPLDVGEGQATLRGSWQRVPRGPVLAITPFNFPLNLVAHKVAPALACGASVVLKPAPQTPLTSLRLAEIVREAGAIENALQVVPCENDVAETLVRSDAFAVLSFTGSDKVGWHLKAIAGKKHVLLELGGNAACIVHQDARDFGSVATKIAASAFNYAGQVCIKTQRLYVHEAVVDTLLAELLPRARAFVPSDPKTATCTIGPMIDRRAAERVDAWIDEATAKGAEALLRGVRQDNRLPPAVMRIGGDGTGLEIVDEEAFGPVLTVHTYHDFSDAVRMAGATRYGLQAGLFTDSLSRMHEALDALEVGALVVGDVPSTRVDAMPYGGRRDSGIGREGVRFAMEEMTDRKMLVVRGA